MLKIILFLAFITPLLAVQLGNFQITLINATNYNQRVIYFREVNGPNLVGAEFATVSKTRQQNTVTYDGVQAICYQYGLVGPTAAIAYFTDSGTITNTSNGYDVDITGASNFIGVRHHQILEVSATGAVINTYPLGSFNWAIINTTNNANYGFLVLQGTSATVALTVEFHFIVASSVANITVDPIDSGVLLSPKGFEQIVVISGPNYKFTTAGNSLAMVSYVVTGQASIMANVQTVTGQAASSQIGIGSGTMALTYKSAVKAVIGSGSSVSYAGVNVSITGTSDFTVIGVNDIVKQVMAKYSATASIYKVQVTYPAGATCIKYDPTSTSGGDPSQTGIQNGSVALGINILLLAFLLALCLFF
jgi:hypothetical protein